jgi:formylglycine-generating enzyme required for sulfatase activity
MQPIKGGMNMLSGFIMRSNRKAFSVQSPFTLLACGVAVAAIAMFVSPSILQANNIQIENVTLNNLDTISDHVDIQFDLSWDNSWRLTSAPGNWDAAWIFAKWKLQSGGEWSHCTLSSTDKDHTAVDGAVIDASFSVDDNGTGVFVYRSATGTGSNDWNQLRLQWQYGIDGVDDNVAVEVKVFAIEMVYIPQGAFYVGDADGDAPNCFHDGDDNGPYFIASEGVITVGTGDGELYYEPVNLHAGDQSGPIPEDFPKGFNAFYCMKYEISQGQYADFLNTLTATEDANRFPDEYGNWRHTIGGTVGNRMADVLDRACNFLSWMDGVAYADWAGLRPMTELEFEKICRGTENVVDDEYVWGNANINQTVYTLANDGQPDESIANAAAEPVGNALNSTVGVGIPVGGPVRCGIFATGNSTRAEAGASYYGVLDMAGNLWEREVTVGNPTCRAFTGVHGNGELSLDGYANVSDWPGYIAGEVTATGGIGIRGGSLNNVHGMRTSERNDASNTSTGRVFSFGFRGVRSE